MAEHQVIVNTEECIGCGLCAKDCVAFHIEIKDGKAQINDGACIYCGHCEAVCPQNAIRLTGYQDKTVDFQEQTRLDPQELLKAIRTRRTIRHFTRQQVSSEITEQILEAGRLAPTGANAQDTSFIILDKRKSEAEKIAVQIFRRLFRVGRKFIPSLQNMHIADDFFFKKAPLVIVIVSKNKVNASLAAQNMAFMAEANGLGVLFSGFFTGVANRSNKLRKVLELKRGQKVVTTLVIGYSQIRYRRTIRREPIAKKYL